MTFPWGVFQTNNRCNLFWYSSFNILCHSEKSFYDEINFLKYFSEDSYQIDVL